MRKRRTGLYAAAFAITTIIFVLGILLGMVVEERRINYAEVRYSQDRVNYESLQLQQLYLATLSNGEGCEAFSATLDNYVKRLEETRTRVERYSEDASLQPRELDELRRRYVIAELNYWLLARKTKETCESDVVSVVYFYSKDCSECQNQGYVLDYLKKVFGERLLVFALDADFKQEDMIAIVKNTFNVTQTPSLIVESEKFEGFISKDKLSEIICREYKIKPEDC